MEKEKVFETQDAARVLDAFLSRLSVMDLNRLSLAHLECWHAAMNQGTAAQVECRRRAEEAAVQVLQAMSEHDFALILSQIKQCAGKLENMR